MNWLKKAIIIIGLIIILGCKNDLLQAVKDGQPQDDQTEQEEPGDEV